MSATRWTAAALLAAAAISMGGWRAPRASRKGDKYSARLAWVPTAGADRVSGKGTAAATLSGRALTITGCSKGWAGRPPSRGCTKASPRARAASRWPTSRSPRRRAAPSRVGHADRRAGGSAAAGQALHPDPRRQRARAGRREPVGVAAAMSTTHAAVAERDCFCASLALVTAGQAPHRRAVHRRTGRRRTRRLRDHLRGLPRRGPRGPAAARRAGVPRRLGQPHDARSADRGAGDAARAARRPARSHLPRHRRVHPAVQRRDAGHAGADRHHRVPIGSFLRGRRRRRRQAPRRTRRRTGGAGPRRRPGRRRARTRPARAAVLGLTVAGEVRNYVPVTDEMLRNPPPGDWLMVRRDYSASSYSPLDADHARQRRRSCSWRGSGR